MSVKNKLLTTVAALSLMGGAAVAQSTTTEQPTTEMSQSEYAPGWNENLDTTYGDIADRQIPELVGMNVVTEGGDDVGEVDNFVLMQDRIQAVVGVGGFLGLGEHEVALPLDELQYDGEKLIISYTEDELKAMPEYTEELEQTAFNEGDTFRTRTMPADQSDTAMAEGDAAMPEGENADEAMAEGDATMSTDQNADETVAEGDAATDEDWTAMDMADGTMESDADEAGAPSGEDVAAAEEAAGDADTATEEVAEAEKGAIEQEAEEMAAEADAAVSEGAEDASQMAENAGEAVEEGAEDAAQTAENAAEATGDAVEEGAENVAEAADATGDAVEEGAEEVADAASDTAGTWEERLDGEFAQIADAPVADVTAFPVANDQGETIGEIEAIARHNDQVVALVGVGGFLGIGEHNVALDMNELTFDGEKFIASGYTEEDLKAMPQYDEETIERIEGDVTLRSAL